MCCRYYIDGESIELSAIIREMQHSPLMKRWPDATSVKCSGEIRPMDVAPVIAPDRRGGRAAREGGSEGTGLGMDMVRQLYLHMQGLFCI